MNVNFVEIEIAAKIVKAKHPNEQAKSAIEDFVNLLVGVDSKDKLHLFYKVNKDLFEEPKL